MTTLPIVEIDGRRYVPQDGAGLRVGVGVTTHNRRDIFDRCIAEVRRLTPEAKIVVVDDASKVPVEGADHRFDEQAGIARAKNKCLELLSDCEHIFLLDDDCHPKKAGWWKPYVESPEPHLMRIFGDLAGKRKIRDNTCIYEDSRHVAWAHARGMMLYVHRPVLDVVGGFDPGFGLWGWEHADWSNRIHAAGLTTWRYADVAGGEELIYSCDECESIERSVPKSVRDQLVDVNGERAASRKQSPLYCEWREQHDLVVTTLFTGQKDPQRGRRMKADAGLLAGLLDSLPADQRALVLHDGLSVENTSYVSYQRVEAPLSPYWQRWLSIWQHLRAHPEVRFVWCVDGTDVEMLRDPFPRMEAGKLYLGSEATTLSHPWLTAHHSNRALHTLVEKSPHLQLLNAGLVGGDRDTVMAFLHDMIRGWGDNLIDQHFGADESAGETDMGIFNLVAWTKWAHRLVVGPQVNTVFKADERNDWSWWKHK